MRDIQIHMFKTNDTVLNPVKAWAKTVQRILSYKESSDNSKVCTFQTKTGKIINITADDARTRLRAIVDTIGKEKLGFTKDEVGLQSLRSGGAMAMFLSGTSTIVIRRIGRWSSDAYLEYIREQVEDFTAGVAEKMLQFESFSNLRKDNAVTASSPLNQLNSEDGPASAPCTVQYSKLVLEQDLEMNMRRRRR